MAASSADREVQIAQLRADRAVQIALFRYRMQRPGVPLSEARSFRISLCTDGRISFYKGQLQWTRWHGSWELNQKTIFMRFHWNGDERNLKLCVCAPQDHAVPQNVWLGMDYKGRRVTMEWWCVYNSALGFEPWGDRLEHQRTRLLDDSCTTSHTTSSNHPTALHSIRCRGFPR